MNAQLLALLKQLRQPESSDEPPSEHDIGYEQASREIADQLEAALAAPSKEAGVSKWIYEGNFGCDPDGVFADWRFSGRPIGADVAERALDALDDACMAMNHRHGDKHRVSWHGYSREQRIEVMRAALANPPGDQRQKGRYCDACEQYVTEPCQSVDCSTPESPPPEAAAAVGEDLLDSLIGSSRDDQRKGLTFMSPTTALFRKRVLAALASPTGPQPASADVDDAMVERAAAEIREAWTHGECALRSYMRAALLAAIKGDSHAG